jgi:hypothetical protein
MIEIQIQHGFRNVRLPDNVPKGDLVPVGHCFTSITLWSISANKGFECKLQSTQFAFGRSRKQTKQRTCAIYP